MCSKSKLAKIVLSGSLTVVNNGYVTTKVIYSTAHMCRELCVTAEVTYSTAHGHHKVLTWS